MIQDLAHLEALKPPLELDPKAWSSLIEKGTKI